MSSVLKKGDKLNLSLSLSPLDGLVQERSNSIVNVLELRLSYTYPARSDMWEIFEPVYTVSLKFFVCTGQLDCGQSLTHLTLWELCL